MASIDLKLEANKRARKRGSVAFLRGIPSSILTYGILVVGVIISIFPYWLALITSLKPANQIFEGLPWSLPQSFTLQNYLDMLTQYSFLDYMANSLIYACVTTIGQLVFSTFAAYAFARMNFPGRDTIFWLYLATMMVPGIVTLIPLFLLMSKLGLTNTYYGLIIPSVLGTPYGIFLMRQFFRTIPEDLESSARIEGAGTLQTLWLIILPLSRPVLATLALITFVTAWNDFLWPLIVTSDREMRLLTGGITLFQTAHGAQWHLMMAGTFLTLAPLLLLFFIFQKQIVRSIHLSGFK